MKLVASAVIVALSFGLAAPLQAKTLDCTFTAYGTTGYNAGKHRKVAQSYIPPSQKFVIDGDDVKMFGSNNRYQTATLVSDGPSRLKFEKIGADVKGAYARTYYSYIYKTGIIIGRVDFKKYRDIGPVHGTCRFTK